MSEAIRPIYCHFSFRRPRGENYGIFSCALYTDFNGKNLIARRTRAYELWENQQHITAIQSYWHALECIFEWQNKLIKYGITNVLLVTQNSTLEGWIIGDKVNKKYTKWMTKANNAFSASQKKEIKLPVGICKARDYEKSRKYCKEEFVENGIPKKVGDKTTYKLSLEGAKSITDVISEEEADLNRGIKTIK